MGVYFPSNFFLHSLMDQGWWWGCKWIFSFNQGLSWPLTPPHHAGALTQFLGGSNLSLFSPIHTFSIRKGVTKKRFYLWLFLKLWVGFQFSLNSMFVWHILPLLLFSFFCFPEIFWENQSIFFEFKSPKKRFYSLQLPLRKIHDIFINYILVWTWVVTSHLLRMGLFLSEI